VQGAVALPSPSYATINPSFQKDEWTYDEEQLMLHYHNDIGNKWAVIGSKLAGRYFTPNTALTTASRTTSTLSCGRPLGR
jgi:hypothetical protein